MFVERPPWTSSLMSGLPTPGHNGRVQGGTGGQKQSRILRARKYVSVPISLHDALFGGGNGECADASADVSVASSSSLGPPTDATACDIACANSETSCAQSEHDDPHLLSDDVRQNPTTKNEGLQMRCGRPSLQITAVSAKKTCNCQVRHKTNPCQTIG